MDPNGDIRSEGTISVVSDQGKSMNLSTGDLYRVEMENGDTVDMQFTALVTKTIKGRKCPFLSLRPLAPVTSKIVVYLFNAKRSADTEDEKQAVNAAAELGISVRDFASVDVPIEWLLARNFTILSRRPLVIPLAGPKDLSDEDIKRLDKILFPSDSEDD